MKMPLHTIPPDTWTSKSARSRAWRIQYTRAPSSPPPSSYCVAGGADARLSRFGDHCADWNGHFLFWQHDQAQLLDVLGGGGGKQILAICA